MRKFLALLLVVTLITMPLSVFADKGGNGKGSPDVGANKDKKVETVAPINEATQLSGTTISDNAKDKLLDQKKVLHEAYLEARKSGDLKKLQEVVSQIEQAKLELTKQIKSQYTSEELEKLAELGLTFKKINPSLTVLPVEKIIARNAQFKFDVPPVIKSGRILVPVRALIQAYGADIKWDPVESKATITKDDKVLVLQMNNDTVLVNGEPMKIDVPAENMDGRIVVPLRFIVEQLGLKVEVDEEGTVVIGDDTGGAETPADNTTTPTQNTTLPVDDQTSSN